MVKTVRVIWVRIAWFLFRFCNAVVQLALWITVCDTPCWFWFQKCSRAAGITSDLSRLMQSHSQTKFLFNSDLRHDAPFRTYIPNTQQPKIPSHNPQQNITGKSSPNIFLTFRCYQQCLQCWMSFQLIYLCYTRYSVRVSQNISSFLLFFIIFSAVFLLLFINIFWA